MRKFLERSDCQAGPQWAGHLRPLPPRCGLPLRVGVPTPAARCFPRPLQVALADAFYGGGIVRPFQGRPITCPRTSSHPQPTFPGGSPLRPPQFLSGPFAGLAPPETLCPPPITVQGRLDQNAEARGPRVAPACFQVLVKQATTWQEPVVRLPGCLALCGHDLQSCHRPLGAEPELLPPASASWRWKH